MRMPLIIPVFLLTARVIAGTSPVLPAPEGSLNEAGRIWLEAIIEKERALELEEASWDEEKAYLEELIASAKRRNREMLGQIGELEEVVVRREREEAERQLSLARMDHQYGLLLDRLEKWSARLPDLTEAASHQLKREIEIALSQLVRRSSYEDPVTSAMRLQTILEITEKLNRFMSEPVRATEIWINPDGNEEVAEVIYLGLGFSLYYMAMTGEAGYRRYDGQSWIRTPDPDLRDRILEYRDALMGQKQEGIIHFPAEIVR